MSEYVIYVCSQCHCLACFNAEQSDDNFPLVSQLTAIDKKKIQQFLESKSIKNDSKLIPKLQLCSNCIEKEIERMKTKEKLIEDFKNGIDLVNSEKIEAEMSKTDMDYFEKPSAARHIEKRSNIKENLPKSSSKHNPRQIPKKAYPEHMCFDISFNGQYGTINSLRVGSLKSCPVPQQEVQNGLYLICRYLQFLLIENSVPYDDFKLGSKIIFIVKGKQHELFYQEKKSCVSEFNIALNKMMCYFEELFIVLSKRAISGPNRIESSNALINGRSYLYSISNPFDFVIGMKKLLINLKAVQMLQTFT